MPIPPEVIETIRERVDIVEIVSKSVTLKRRGTSFVGLCPFHQEKTPSFNVVPHKNILTQSVGYHGPVEPDTSTRPIEEGDIFILCSDGLTDPLDDAALADIVRSHEPEDLAEVLVQQAIENGTEDNVTVVVVHIQP